MAHRLPDLPYAKDALAPHLSQETLEYHHGKHHATYVTKLNGFVEGTAFANWSLEELIQRISEIEESKRKPIFNNAAQHYNHSFYWKCMRPQGGGEPKGNLGNAITQAFGSFESFKQKFTDAAVNHFGSGWAWLVLNQGGKLEVLGTHDADTPLAHHQTPLLTCDVWEHAYYIDYRNARPKYVENFWHLINWDFVAENFSK